MWWGAGEATGWPTPWATRAAVRADMLTLLQQLQAPLQTLDWVGTSMGG
jgi:hypothetical protein